MENIYVMKTQHKHTYSEVLNGLLNNESYYLTYIKSNNFEEDDLGGLKLFLENNNYNLKALQYFTQVNPQDIHTKKSNPIGFYKIAASFFVLIGLGLLLNYHSNKSQAIEKYMIVDPGFKVLMGSNTIPLELLNGMNYYRNSNYEAALDHFNKLPINDTALFYSGLCAIALKDHDAAKNYFIEIPNGSIYKDKSSFYIALCFIYNKQNDQVIQMLKSTTFTDSIFLLKRNEILKDLEN